jgi:acyl-CoA reductase-like NAD-dependent aldehyde dehydrogenase
MHSLSRLQRYSFAIRTYSNFYGGQFVPSNSTKFYEVYNPVTQEHVARSPQSTQEEFNAVVASAKEAFPTWSRTPLLSTSTITQLVNVTCSNLPI